MNIQVPRPRMPLAAEMGRIESYGDVDGLQAVLDALRHYK